VTDREDKTMRQFVCTILPDRHLQVVLRYYFVGLNDRVIGKIFGTVRSTVCAQRNSSIKTLRLLMEEILVLLYGQLFL